MNIQNLLNKNILVGLTYFSSDGEIKESIQLHGPIKDISNNTLNFERSDTKEIFSIPYGEDTIEDSDEEYVYELKSTNEVVTNISYVASFNIYPPEEKDA